MPRSGPTGEITGHQPTHNLANQAMSNAVISREDIWDFGPRDTFEQWLTLAERAREEHPILKGLTLREIITAQRYEYLDLQSMMEPENG